MKKKINFVPRIYRRAPRLTAERFVDFIAAKEGKRRNGHYALKIDRDEARQIFAILRGQSRDAKQEGNRDGIWITYDDVTAEWGGYETPFHCYGIEGRVREGSYREMLGKLSPMSREGMLNQIIAACDCHRKEGERIFHVCRTNGVLLFDENTNLWRGCDCDDMPSLKDKVARFPLTEKQRSYRERYGDMPPGKHKVIYAERGKDYSQSEPVAWIAKRDGSSLEDAFTVYNRGWNCSRDKGKLPWSKLPDGRVQGVYYIELTDEIRSAVTRLHPRTNESSFIDSIAMKIFSDECEVNWTVVFEKAHRIYKKATDEDLCRSGKVERKDKNTGAITMETVYAGKAFWHELEKKRAAKEAEQREKERLEAEKRDKERLEGRPSIESIAPTLRLMPQMPDEFEAEDWIRRKLGAHVDASWLYGLGRDYNHIRYGDEGPYGADWKPTAEEQKAA